MFSKEENVKAKQQQQHEAKSRNFQVKSTAVIHQLYWAKPERTSSVSYVAVQEAAFLK